MTTGVDKEEVNHEGEGTIRPLVESDLPELLEMVRELAAFEKLSHLVVAGEAEYRHAFFGPSPSASCLVIDVGVGLSGYAIYFPTFSTFLGIAGIWLEDLYVRPEWRNKGQGQHLLKAVGAIARERGAGRFEWSVLDWNTPAIGFYRKMGASILEEWKIARLDAEGIKQLVEH